MSESAKKRRTVSMEPILQDFTVTSFSDLNPDVPGPSDSSFFEKIVTGNNDVQINTTLNETNLNLSSGPYPSDSSLNNLSLFKNLSKSKKKVQPPFQKRSTKKSVRDSHFDSLLKNSDPDSSDEIVQKPFQRKVRYKVRPSMFDVELNTSESSFNDSSFKKPFSLIKKPFQRQSKNKRKSNLFDSLIKDSPQNTPEAQISRPFQRKSKNKVSSSLFDEDLSNNSIDESPPVQNFITRRTRRRKINESNLFCDDLNSSQSDVSPLVKPLGIKHALKSNHNKENDTSMFDDVFDNTETEDTEVKEPETASDEETMRPETEEEEPEESETEDTEVKEPETASDEETMRPETEEEEPEESETEDTEVKEPETASDEETMGPETEEEEPDKSETENKQLKYHDNTETEDTEVKEPETASDEETMGPETEEEEPDKSETENKQLKYHDNTETEDTEVKKPETASDKETMGPETKEEELKKSETENKQLKYHETEDKEIKELETEGEGAKYTETEYVKNEKLEEILREIVSVTEGLNQSDCSDQDETIKLEDNWSIQSDLTGDKGIEIKENKEKNQFSVDWKSTTSSTSNKEGNESLKINDSSKDTEAFKSKDNEDESISCGEISCLADSISIRSDAVSVESTKSLLRPRNRHPSLHAQLGQMPICTPDVSFKDMPSSTPNPKGKRVSFLLKENVHKENIENYVHNATHGNQSQIQMSIRPASSAFSNIQNLDVSHKAETIDETSNMDNNENLSRRKSSLRTRKSSIDKTVSNLTKDISVYSKKRRVSHKAETINETSNMNNNENLSRRKSSLRTRKSSIDKTVSNLTKDISVYSKKRRVSFKIGNDTMTQSNFENSDKLEQSKRNQSNQYRSSISLESLVYENPSESETPNSGSVYLDIHASRGKSTSSSDADLFSRNISKHLKNNDSCANERIVNKESHLYGEKDRSLKKNLSNDCYKEENLKESIQIDKETSEDEKEKSTLNKEVNEETSEDEKEKSTLNKEVNETRENVLAVLEGEFEEEEEEEGSAEEGEEEKESEEEEEVESEEEEEVESEEEEEVESEEEEEVEFEEEEESKEREEQVSTDEQESEEEEGAKEGEMQVLTDEQESEEEEVQVVKASKKVEEGNIGKEHGNNKTNNTEHEEFHVNNRVASSKRDENVSTEINMNGEFIFPSVAPKLKKKIRRTSIFREQVLEIPSKAQLKEMLNRLQFSELKKKKKGKLSEHSISREQLQQYEIEEELRKNQQQKKSQNKAMLIKPSSNKLKRPKKWVSPKLYDFLIEKLKPQFGIRCRVRAEELVLSLVERVERIEKKKELEREDVEEMKNELAGLGIVRTHWDFFLFVNKFFDFFLKEKMYPSLPGKGHSAFEYGPTNVMENIL